MPPANIDRFNTIVGLIFVQLYQSFPMHTEIDEVGLANALGVTVIDNTPTEDWPDSAPRIINFGPFEDGTHLRTWVISSALWLRDEGFITAEGDHATQQVRLTSKAFTALNTSLSSIEPKLGNQLNSAAKQAGSEAGRALIGETVGQIIGAAVRSFSG